MCQYASSLSITFSPNSYSCPDKTREQKPIKPILFPCLQRFPELYILSWTDAKRKFTEMLKHIANASFQSTAFSNFYRKIFLIRINKTYFIHFLCLLISTKRTSKQSPTKTNQPTTTPPLIY